MCNYCIEKIKLSPVAFALILLLAVNFACNPKKPQEKQVGTPNIIVLIADDLGYDDLGLHQNTVIRTPHLNALGEEGVQFRQFYVNPVCAPTRASFLTGRHFLKTGVSHVHGGKDFIHPEEILLPEALKENGYVTGMWGKWHSGHTSGYYPWERGFDEAYMARLYKHEDSEGLFNGKPVKHNKWADEVIVDYAIDFIERHRDTTFFAMLPFLSPHTPLAAPSDFIEIYQKRGLNQNFATLYGMISHMDAHIGRLLNKLEELELSEKTMVLFFSDNGPQIMTNTLTPEERQKRYVSGLTGHKGNIWENGVKSPLLIRLPVALEASIVHQLTDITDIYPTLVEIAGGRYPEAQLPLDGRSIANLLFDNMQLPEKASFNFAQRGWPPSDDRPYTVEGIKREYDPEKKDTMQWENQIMYVRKGDYKLLINPQPSLGSVPLHDNYALFNIREDPREQHNLTAEKPMIVAELQPLLQQHFQEIMEAPHAFEMPTFSIGVAGEYDNVVLAKAPIEIGPNLKNTVRELRYWKNEEDYAIYKIAVEQAGRYVPHLRYKKSSCRAEPVIQLSTDQSVVTATLTHPEEQPLGELMLVAGYQEIKLSIQSAGDIPCDTLLHHVESIYFDPIP